MTNADEDIDVLKISFEPVETKPCDSCLRPCEALRTRQGDAICDNCRAMFVFAKVLFKKGIDDEAEIIATLAYAAHRGVRGLIHWKDIAGKDGLYGRFDITRVVKGVPILRPKPAVAEIVRYPGKHLPRLVRIEVLSKYAKPETIAELYHDTLQREALPVFKTSPGSISWEYKDARLVVNVGPREEIQTSRLDHLGEYPQVYRFSFPMPNVVRAVCHALLGDPRRPGTAGNEIFASGLGDHGRPQIMSMETLIPACVAWYVGEHDEHTKPKDRRRRVATMLNKHLLKPLGKALLWDDPYNPEDLVWADAKQVGPRFDRARLFLQDNQRVHF